MPKDFNLNGTRTGVRGGRGKVGSNVWIFCATTVILTLDFQFEFFFFFNKRAAI